MPIASITLEFPKSCLTFPPASAYKMEIAQTTIASKTKKMQNRPRAQVQKNSRVTGNIDHFDVKIDPNQVQIDPKMKKTLSKNS